MNRPRRQSTRSTIVESENESDSERNSENEPDEYRPSTSKQTPKLPQKSKNSRQCQKKLDSQTTELKSDHKRYRMKKNEDEIFIKLAIEHFDEINNTTTKRGTPASPAIKLREKLLQSAWEKIATQMNTSLNVSRTNCAFFYVVTVQTFPLFYGKLW